jgi:hypothetical protein
MATIVLHTCVRHLEKVYLPTSRPKAALRTGIARGGHIYIVHECSEYIGDKLRPISNCNIKKLHPEGPFFHGAC